MLNTSTFRNNNEVPISKSLGNKMHGELNQRLHGSQAYPQMPKEIQGLVN